MFTRRSGFSPAPPQCAHRRHHSLLGCGCVRMLGVLRLRDVHIGPPSVSFRRNLSESRMLEIRTSGLMSGEGKPPAASRSRSAPFLDSTLASRSIGKFRGPIRHHPAPSCRGHGAGWWCYRPQLRDHTSSPDGGVHEIIAPDVIAMRGASDGSNCRSFCHSRSRALLLRGNLRLSRPQIRCARSLPTRQPADSSSAVIRR